MFDFFQKLLDQLTSNKGKDKAKSDPKELLDNLQPQIEAVSANCIRIKTHISTTLKLENSKFGGLPFFPISQPFPTSTDGKPMRLLAQLNFGEIPYLSPYPSEGLLQFYIAEEDDLHGLDFDHPTKQENWRVLFFDTLDFEARKDLADLYPNDWKYAPLQKTPLGLEFEVLKDYPSFPALEYERGVQPIFEQITDEDAKDLVEDLYIGSERGMGHKIGGFPYYTQAEVRSYHEDLHDYQLLLQIDSEGEKIMWGDVGVANFFMRYEDLVKRDFSKVLYNWDCH